MKIPKIPFDPARDSKFVTLRHIKEAVALYGHFWSPLRGADKLQRCYLDKVEGAYIDCFTGEVFGCTDAALLQELQQVIAQAKEEAKTDIEERTKGEAK